MTKLECVFRWEVSYDVLNVSEFLDEKLSFIKEIGGVFRFGNGVLGKSAIALGILLAIFLIAVFRLHTDKGILFSLGGATAIFFFWLLAVLMFADKHPDLALLDGAEWSTYKRFEAESKSGHPSADQKVLMPPPRNPALPPAGPDGENK